ncbi:MAG: hypothetical protein ACPG49_13625, partial [Chitinophagales bacterium]
PLLALAADGKVQGTSTIQKSHVLLFTLFVCFLSTTLLSFTPKTATSTLKEANTIDGIIGTIVMIEDILSVNSNDPNNSITKVEVYSVTQILVHEETQCHSSICSTNLGHLAPAEYFVVAYVQSGNIFSAHILIR